MKILTLKHLWHSRCWMRTYLQTFLYIISFISMKVFVRKKRLPWFSKTFCIHHNSQKDHILTECKVGFFFQKVNTPLKSSLKPGLGGLYCNKVAAKTSFLHLVTGDDFLNLHNSYDTNIITCVTYVWYLNPSL